MARKFADRWLYKALGSGLHGRAIHRREKGDPRQKLINAVRVIPLLKGKPEKVSPMQSPLLTKPELEIS